MKTLNRSACSKTSRGSVITAGLLLLLSSYGIAVADSATWKVTPFNVDWNTAANWRPMVVPNGPDDIATFHFSKITTISIAHSLNPLDDTLTEVKGIVFEPGIDGASAYTVTLGHPFELRIGDGGIVNTSGLTQTFVTEANVNGELPGQVTFNQGATTGDLTTFINKSPPVRVPGGARKGFQGGTVFNFGSSAGHGTFVNTTGGATIFGFGSSAGNGTFINSKGGSTIFEVRGGATAAHGSFTNKGGEVSGAVGGTVTFGGTSTAGDANFTVDGGMVNGARGGFVGFFEGNCHTCTPPTAGNATFTINGGAVSGANGGLLQFFNRSTAGNATLIANGDASAGEGGTILFADRSTGGTVRVEVFGTGALDISGRTVTSQTAGVTVGSIEGSGVAFLGSRDLTVGSNNLSTVFSGVMQDGGIGGGIGGGLVKIGTGTLTLASANTYTGRTTINEGALLVNNKSGSGTGSALVQVNGGTLGGSGTIDGPVMVGTGSGSGAVLAPGKTNNTIGALTTQKKLTFNSDGTYECDLNSSTARADKVIAHRVTINAGAQFSFADLGSGTLPSGTVFTVIENDTPGAIEGTFANLPDGATFTSGANTFRATYEGGTGNDLTLTVQ
jgi:autotransporter-associated beta strand protein